jgi:predicted porin
MHKKLVAVAVAGALAAPVLAVAQSTVQIYGRVTYEYGIADGGDRYDSTDYADTPGGSAIGFKGVETLGGGMSAWFQCETSADIRGFDTVGLCSRNSAVGFRGGFGNVFFGKWDTPAKRALNVGTVGAEETGILGMSFLPFGGSGGTTTSPTASGSGGLSRERWKRREDCLTTYETPSWGGFQVMGAFSCKNRPFDEALTDGVANSDTRIWSVGATYVNGPFGIGAAYEEHKNFGTVGATTGGLDDKGYGASVSYEFGKSVKVGATYLRREWEMPTGDLKKNTATVGVEWNIAGPHEIHAQYAWAGDSKGDSLTGLGGRGGAAAPGSGTGADAWSIAYQYAFSKRTTIKFGYVRVDNDKNSTSYYLGNAPRPLDNGENVDAFAFLIKHNF